MGIKVAIDGPVAAGKSSVAKEVAKRLNMTYVDTGAMYRAVALSAVEQNINVDDEKEMTDLVGKLTINIEGSKILLNGNDVSEKIRTDKISLLTSKVASYKGVRERIVKLQQDMINNGNILMDGRDIGTVVIPNADVKIYLVASVESRAQRRFLDNQRRGIPAELEQIKKDIETRDHNDMTRVVSPLKKADDAIELDTSNLSYEESIQGVINIINKKR